MRSPAPPALPSKRKEKAEVSQRKRANAKAKRQHYQVLVGKNAGLRAQIAAFKEKAMAMVAQAVAREAERATELVLARRCTCLGAGLQRPSHR